ncbi:transcriptional regulator FlhC [Salmonella enterica]|nr:transcriptional regulator FlhC [Salmonella enterica]ECG1721549.1 transcriptional regulator FlhC [Salmonella enterica subsp. diarizonae serovar 17:z10:e,n,x,z15]EDQ7381175.1 transcriptional regulator FlhC [Salmonella enterica subsp. diarizonae serovar 35:l,v:z35]EAA9598942.1 transcriptional regulator FlhC [Salmonella enterica]EAM9431777.1 transcriptional regulator FlhC [Salmonella enterica]
MASESILQELEDTQLAIELISPGTRMQLLEHTVRLSRGKITREHNVHSSLFCNIFDSIKKQSSGEPTVKILIRAYRAYLKYAGNTETLSLTRAWILRRFVDSGILDYTPCCKCGGKFITHAGEPVHGYQCVMCHPPSRAVKKAAAE